MLLTNILPNIATWSGIAVSLGSAHFPINQILPNFCTHSTCPKDEDMISNYYSVLCWLYPLKTYLNCSDLICLIYQQPKTFVTDPRPFKPMPALVVSKYPLGAMEKESVLQCHPTSPPSIRQKN